VGGGWRVEERFSGLRYVHRMYVLVGVLGLGVPPGAKQSVKTTSFMLHSFRVSN
jgi:hypothetical protein